MPITVGYFAMTSWRRKNAFQTIGGYSNSKRQRKVFQYLKDKNCWCSLPKLPESFALSTATEFGDILYSIADTEDPCSIYWLDLVSPDMRWKETKEVGIFNFKSWEKREATVLWNQIVNFGFTSRQSTVVLEREKGSNTLEVKSKSDGFDCANESQYSLFCTFNQKIYSFAYYADTYTVSLDVESGKTSQYYCFNWKSILVIN